MDKDFYDRLKISRQESDPSSPEARRQTDHAREDVEDLNAVGNQAINALLEGADHLAFSADVLLRTQQALETSLSHEQLVYQGGIVALLKVIEAKNGLTGHHIERMVLFSIEIALSYGISELEMLKSILFIAALHDIGKVGIRDEVLNKPGSLTEAEKTHVQAHASLGANIVASFPGWEEIGFGVLSHHEWWDGAGYPHGWSGEQIPLEARIVAVADVFDAVTSLRPYREPFPYFAARVHIEREAETHFDPQVVAAFLKIPETRWESLKRITELTALEDLLRAPLSVGLITLH